MASREAVIASKKVPLGTSKAKMALSPTAVVQITSVLDEDLVTS